MKGKLWALMAVAILAGCGGGPPRLLNLEGELERPLGEHAPALVFLFTAIECPISNRYAPEVRRIHDRFAPRGVRFWLVYVDPDATPEAIRRHVEAYDLPLAVLRDPEHDLVRLTGASVTPEVVVISDDGAFAYRGRIDNRYVEFGVSRPAPTVHDLEDALDAILSGRPVVDPRTKAVGCFIPGRE